MNKKKSMVENIVITLKLYFDNAEVEVYGSDSFKKSNKS